MPTSKKVTMDILVEQASCLQKYGCFIAQLLPDDSISVGYQVDAIYGGHTTETIIVAIQENHGGKSTYVMVNKTMIKPSAQEGNEG